jgi:hypothetical protein
MLRYARHALLPPSSYVVQRWTNSPGHMLHRTRLIAPKPVQWLT